MALIGVLQTMVDGTVITAAQHNSNYGDIKTAFNTSAVLTDVAKTITVGHTWAAGQVWSAVQNFTGGIKFGPITSDLLFTDATYDIGKDGATRPRDGYFSGRLKSSGGLVSDADATFQANINGAPGKRIIIGSAFLGSYFGNYAEVGYNIESGPNYVGADFASRIRFDSGGLNFDTAPVGVGGAGIVFTTRWKVTQAGHFIAGTDGVSDIGAAGANRPRDIFIYRNFVSGGLITAGDKITGTTGFDAVGGAGLTYYRVNGTVVVGPRLGGYTNGWTGAAANRATAYDAATITLPQLAARVRALQDDLHAATGGHGLIGA